MITFNEKGETMSTNNFSRASLMQKASFKIGMSIEDAFGRVEGDKFKIVSLLVRDSSGTAALVSVTDGVFQLEDPELDPEVKKLIEEEDKAGAFPPDEP